MLVCQSLRVILRVTFTVASPIGKRLSRRTTIIRVTTRLRLKKNITGLGGKVAW